MISAVIRLCGRLRAGALSDAAAAEAYAPLPLQVLPRPGLV